MTDKMFNNLQTDIMKILTRSPDLFLSQYRLYDQIVEDLEIKDPVEKENLKIRFLIVLRTLPFIFDHINIINKNGSLHIKFSNIDTDTEIEKNNVDEILEETKDTQNVMPSEIAVINFIIDENIDEYFYRKDYDGNNILHSLIANNDYTRIKKHFNKLKKLISEKNNNDQTPIEIISDNNITNLFLNNMMIEINSLKKENLILNNWINDLRYLRYFCRDQRYQNYIVYFAFFLLCFTNVIKISL